MKKLSRQDAIKQKSTYYFTGIPCPQGHISKRNTVSCTCIECQRESTNKRRRVIQQEINEK